MSEITIEITNYCPYDCSFCSSNASPTGKHLEFEKIKKFLEENLVKANAIVFERINISGGEPLAHPDFYKILQLCNKLSNNVVVYTNAIKTIAYNTAVIKELNVKANVCLIPASDVYIPKGSFKIHLLKFISQGRGKSIQEVNMSCSSNLCGSEKCESCTNLTLKANGEIVPCPCKKD